MYHHVVFYGINVHCMIGEASTCNVVERGTRRIYHHVVFYGKNVHCMFGEASTCNVVE